MASKLVFIFKFFVRRQFHLSARRITGLGTQFTQVDVAFSTMSSLRKKLLFSNNPDINPLDLMGIRCHAYRKFGAKHDVDLHSSQQLHESTSHCARMQFAIQTRLVSQSQFINRSYQPEITIVNCHHLYDTYFICRRQIYTHLSYEDVCHFTVFWKLLRQPLV